MRSYPPMDMPLGTSTGREGTVALKLPSPFREAVAPKNGRTVFRKRREGSRAIYDVFLNVL